MFLSLLSSLFRTLPALAALLLAACAGAPEANAPLTLRPAAFSELPGWEADDQAAALAAFGKSCTALAKKAPDAPMGPPQAGTAGDWQQICAALPAGPVAPAQARAWFEAHFTPWLASAGGQEEGLFTGYYEASLRGARTRHGPYQVPLRARPADLVMVDLGEFRPALKGERIAGRVKDGRLRPYEARAEIAAGKLPPGQDVPLLWVDDPVEAFFLEIQGSGRVLLDDGSTVRVGYDGQNGQLYYAVGRELVKRGVYTREEVSMQAIRAWMEAHPQETPELMNLNKSYVFFRELPGEGPLGAQGVALTPGRSLAIDRTQLPYGIPLYVDAAPEVRQLMVAQDTGGAIRGAVRGDVFFGYGPAAEDKAGRMKQPGRYWLLLPRQK
jgi:membrane-bound lytic murein transglycosylase A